MITKFLVFQEEFGKYIYIYINRLLALLNIIIIVQSIAFLVLYI